MEKPLHERLRGWVADSREKNAYPSSFANEELNNPKHRSIEPIEEERELFTIIADEMEREIKEITEAQRSSAHHIIKQWAEANDMPMKDKESITEWINRWFITRTRFEDGEPVQFGDEVEGCHGVAKCFLIFEDGSGMVYGEEDDVFGDDILNIGDDISGINKFVVKRPTPKVYDADDVEIKVGDTVWFAKKDPNRCKETSATVRMVDDRGVNLSCDGSLVWYDGDWFTHERPVFDAEGVRICKGDTVYDVAGINQEPMRVLNYGDALVNVMSKSGIEKDYEFNELTHREPDSLEKLQQFAVDSAAYADGCEQDKFMEIADRLKALIERGA